MSSRSPLHLAVDASSIREGGGVTHLVELLHVANPAAYGFSRVTVWSCEATLNQIEDRSWLVKRQHPLLDRGPLLRAYWQRFVLSRLARDAGCHALFVPGGSYAGAFHPVISMSQNMLPFDRREMHRYGCSLATLRYLLLRWSQARTFRRVDGLIFLTRYAEEQVMRIVKSTPASVRTIPHGIDERFFNSPPSRTSSVKSYTDDQPFRLLYVSIINFYKHQWNVAEAVASLRLRGVPVALDLVGPAYFPAFKRLQAVLAQIDPQGEFVRYHGPVSRQDLPPLYRDADAFVFASSCENMPNILLEAMASGLPIACSNRGPMPEVLGNAGVFFDPERPDSIGEAIEKLFLSPSLRVELRCASYERARRFSWSSSANATFEFLRELAQQTTSCASPSTR